MRTYTIVENGEEKQISIKPDGDGYIIELDGVSKRFDVLVNKSPMYSFLVDQSKILEAEIGFNKDVCELNVGHVPYKFELFDPRKRLASQAGAGGANANSANIEAPMPGKVVDIKVKVGDEVTKDQAVIVVEAMKMQNELASPMDGIVKEIKAAVGEAVESSKILVTIVKKEG